MGPRANNAITFLARRLITTISAVPFPMVAVYRRNKSDAIVVELYRDQSPELARAEKDGWQIVGTYTRQITEPDLVRDLLACD